MNRTWFDKIHSYLMIRGFYKFCGSIFYLFAIAVMIYIGYSRDAGTSPIKPKLPEKMLNDENYDGIYLPIDSLYWYDSKLAQKS